SRPSSGHDSRYGSGARSGGRPFRRRARSAAILSPPFDDGVLDDLGARPAEMLEDGGEMARLAPLEPQLAARDRRRDRVGSRLDPVRDDAMLGAAKTRGSFDRDDRAPRSVDPRPHLLQEKGQILDLGLLGRVAQDGGPARETGR